MEIFVRMLALPIILTRYMDQVTSEFYRDLHQQLSGLLAGEADLIASLANTSALIYHKLASINWAGFYLLQGNELVLGPFQGKPACVRIPVGKGVCGTAIANNQTLLVGNVHEFDGHIACDMASNAEIVIPITINQRQLGVLDIDSPQLNRFQQSDRVGLEGLVKILVEHLKRY